MIDLSAFYIPAGESRDDMLPEEDIEDEMIRHEREATEAARKREPESKGHSF